ncbi:MAG: hypothetical protein [Bacteriophage sp.]|nr:MAG: hypothetical protein [Bacteriophage sp.]
MLRTVDLIKKHTQEYNEYMLKNGEYSFHRFTDGSIYFTKPMFVTRNIVKETGISPLRPVRELEELVKAAMDDGALVTINDYITFRGRDVILGETEIAFYNSSIRIEYTGISSIYVDFNHELRKIMEDMQNGRYGNVVFIDGVKIGTNGLVLLGQEFVYFPDDNDLHTQGVYKKYSDVKSIVDITGDYIFWRSKNDSNNHE